MSSKNKYVQFGCGWSSAPNEWTNFDASPTLRFERLPLIGHLYTKNENRFPPNVEYGDIVKGLPVEPNSCNAVYCSHVLEHLSLEDFRKALNNTKLILKPGGVFRLVLPDLEFAINQYMENPSYDAAHNFLRETSLGKEWRPKGIKGLLTTWIGNSSHLWMWDYKSIKKELENTGFIDIRRAYYCDSSDHLFRKVEDYGRWENSLGVECRNTI